MSATPKHIEPAPTPVESPFDIHTTLARMYARMEMREQEREAREAEEKKRVEEREVSRDRRANRVLAIVGGIVGILGPVITGGAVYVSSDGDRIQETERKVQRLGERSVEQEIQLVESVRYLGAKIDAVNPAASAVEKPEAVQAGEKRVEEFTKQKRVQELFAEPIDMDDPLKDTTGP